MNKVRTRYAPSPTGYFHIGGARTALFNYLYAKHYNGEFIVRIEDTDMERNVKGGAESQLNNLKWLNIFADESMLNPTENGPYCQSEKLDVYKKLAHDLLNKKLAYRCFCTPEELETARLSSLERKETPKYSRKCYRLEKNEIEQKLNAKMPYVIRLIVPENKNYEWRDLIRGDMTVPSSAMTDPVILKSSQVAMYNFAVVVDDHDMKITHIFRGEEHISNTPYQIAIKEALGYKDDFIYAHLSIIVDETGKKLSKRNLALEQFIEGFREKGYLSEALVNFIALLGWSDDKNQEIFSMNELIKKFTIEKVSASPAFFDVKKLNWVSSEYFKKMDDTAYLSFVLPYLKNDNAQLKGKEKELALMFKKQLSYASEINDLIHENFHNNLGWENLSGPLKELLQNNDNARNVIKTLAIKLHGVTEWNEESIKVAIKDVQKETAASGKNLFMPIRLAITNLEHGPELSKIISLYPQTMIVSLLNTFAHKIHSHAD